MKYYKKEHVRAPLTERSLSVIDFKEKYPEIDITDFNDKNIREIYITPNVIYALTETMIDKRNSICFEVVASFDTPPTSEKIYSDILNKVELARKNYKNIIDPNAVLINPKTFEIFDRVTEASELKAYINTCKTTLDNLEKELEKAKNSLNIVE